jgi:hypothetical protein
MNIRRHFRLWTAAIVLLSFAVAGQLAGHLTYAAVTNEEAARLKSDLTPLGAEKAGNKDGSIPAWDGGYREVWPGYRSGQPRPDPFAADKPVLQLPAPLAHALETLAHEFQYGKMLQLIQGAKGKGKL